MFQIDLCVGGKYDLGMGNGEKRRILGFFCKKNYDFALLYLNLLELNSFC